MADPIRKTLARFKNFNKSKAEVSAPSSRSVSLSDGDSLSYNKLVLATGSDYNYLDTMFGGRSRPAARASMRRARFAIGCFWLSSERSGRRARLRSRRCLPVIGGGPTGVQMAVAIFELAHFMISRDFQTCSPTICG
ncbi:hypothetical protein EHI44_30955 [Rhizobium leguminosarum]|nr:hypothetical protein EHI44_30955 [Rhizobium leguminosarum]